MGSRPASAGDDLAAPPLDMADAPPDLNSGDHDLALIPDLARPACTHIDEDLATDPSSRWALRGSATWEASAKAIQLNGPSGIARAGSAFYRTKLRVAGVDARFTFYIGDGSGADGMALVFAKASVVEDLEPSGDRVVEDGWRLGYVGMNGFALELDTHKNDNNGDPNDNHVSMMLTANGTHILSGTPMGPKLRNGTIRRAHLRFNGQHVLVEIDDNKVIDADLPSTMAFSPDDYFIGFTGSGGGLPDRHRVHSLSIVVGPADVCF